MTSDSDIEQKFCKEIKDSPFVMLGTEGERGAAMQPMTAQFEGDAAPLWFFTARDNHLVEALGGGSSGGGGNAGGGASGGAIATFASKGHDVFATIRGRLSLDDDPATLDRLWNKVIAQWFEGGKSDPRLALLRLDVDEARIWNSDLGAFLHPVINKLLGRDPLAGERENVAEVSL
jgi:general stress protein 26